MNVAVPAFRDPDGLARTTLAYLDRSGVDPGAVRVFLPDQEDLEAHARTLDPRWHPSLYVTCPGLVASRAAAEATYYPDGTEVVWINDDVKGVKTIDGGEVGLHAVVNELRSEAFMAEARLAGVYPLANPYFMKPTVRMGLAHIVGALYLTVTDASLTPRFGDAKEDYERSLRYYQADGKVVRINWLGVDTTYYNRKRGDPVGGRFGDARTPETVERNVAQLLAEFPGLIRRNTRRKSPFPEVLLPSVRKVRSRR